MFVSIKIREPNFSTKKCMFTRMFFRFLRSDVPLFPSGPLEHQEREVELGKRRKLFSVYDVHEEIGR